MFDEDLFLRAITITIENWPSFQVAINNGMGGPNTNEKVNWMCGMVVQMFKDNPDGSIQADDVLDYLSEVINNEFDTIIEDGSAEMVCSSIMAYYFHISSGNKDFVLGKLESLKAKQAQALLEIRNQQQQQLQAPIVPTPSNSTVKESSTVSAGGDAEMVEAGDGGQSEQKENDGWTVVRRKK